MFRGTGPCRVMFHRVQGQRLWKNCHILLWPHLVLSVRCHRRRCSRGRWRSYSRRSARPSYDVISSDPKRFATSSGTLNIRIKPLHWRHCCGGCSYRCCCCCRLWSMKSPTTPSSLSKPRHAIKSSSPILQQVFNSPSKLLHLNEVCRAI